MDSTVSSGNRRILLIDDNRAIHDDFRKLLAPDTSGEAALAASEAALFGTEPEALRPQIRFEIQSAYQGQEGLELAQTAVAQGRPFALAFIDMRMPPGLDGLETTHRLWAIDSHINVVICTAYSDYSWQEMFEKIERPDQIVILKKPFDAVEAMQLACALTEKWNSQERSARLMADLERTVATRTHQLNETNLALQSEVVKHRNSMLASQNLMSDAVRAYQGLKREVEQRKGLEDQVREQASLLDKAHDAIIVRDLDDRITFWSRGAELLYGWPATEAVGRPAPELLQADHGGDVAARATLLQAGEWAAEVNQKRKDGSTVAVESHESLVRDDHDQPKSILSINTDITRRRAMEEQLQLAQRLEAIGQLTGGIAHDFNNLLTVILGNSELLAEYLQDGKLRALAEMTRSAAQRGAELTRRLLTFARRQPLESKIVDLNQLVTGMEALLRRTLSEDIGIELALGSGLPPTRTDAAQLENAVLNLAINARDAMQGAGRITIQTANATLDQAYADQHPGTAPGCYVSVAVKDTGKGIPPEILKRVFEPFFTTKEFGKGTGLGLSMVYGFVRQAQGYVTIDSEVGRGTTVTMYFPCEAQSVADAAAPVAHATPGAGGKERILLVEDDQLVREYAEGQLKSLGYEVVGAPGGQQALEIIRHDTGIDLLFTDVVMPGGMNGGELARAARELRPALKVLYTSGYTDNAVLDQAGLGREVHLLSKPYSRLDLARKIRAAIEPNATEHP